MGALAKRFGIRQIELRAVSGVVDLPQLAAKERWLEQSRRELLGNDTLDIVAFNASAKLSMPFAEVAPELVAFAPLMEHFQAGYLRVFDGELCGDKPIEQAWRWLDDWEALRARHDWQFALTIETHSSLLRPDDIEALFSRGHPNVFLLWDSHHTWKHTGVSPMETWEAVQPWTQHIHVKDSVSTPSARHPYSYALPGEGEFPLSALLDRLEADGFAGPVSLEWEKMWHPYLPPIEEALRLLPLSRGLSLGRERV